MKSCNSCHGNLFILADVSPTSNQFVQVSVTGHLQA